MGSTSFRALGEGFRHRWLAAVGAVALVCIGAGAAAGGSMIIAAHREANQLPTDLADAVEANDVACATSTSWSNVPGMFTSFTQNGSVTKPVIVMFSAQIGGLGDTHYLVIRLLIDNVVQPGMGSETTFNYSSDPARTGAVNFISGQVAPGAHDVKLQYKVNTGLGGPYRGCLYWRNMIILHN